MRHCRKGLSTSLCTGQGMLHGHQPPNLVLHPVAIAPTLTASQADCTPLRGYCKLTKLSCGCLTFRPKSVLLAPPGAVRVWDSTRLLLPPSCKGNGHTPENVMRCLAYVYVSNVLLQSAER